jgi:hypothetical protein
MHASGSRSSIMRRTRTRSVEASGCMAQCMRDAEQRDKVEAMTNAATAILRI